MELKDIIKSMQKNEKNFIPLLESFKRRAAKGLIEGVSPEDIELAVSELEKEQIEREKPVDASDFSIVKTYAELSEAIDKFERESSNYFKNLNESDWALLDEIADDDMKCEIDRLKPKKESLSEAVTFIGNNGELKTASAEEYNKEMHKYNTETAILGLRKKDKEDSINEEKILNSNIGDFINSELKKEE